MAVGRLGAATVMLATLVQEPGPQAPAPPDPHAHHRAAPAPAEGGWVRYRHQVLGFSLEHPGDWTVSNEKAAVSIHLAHPAKPVHLYVSAFMMREGTLQEFADLKFGVQPEVFKPIGTVRALEGPGWTGLVQDAETPQDEGRTRRRILCARHGGLYMSLALYLDAKELAAPDMDYERLFTSLRFDAGPPTPAPPGTPHH
jgi:hypothetical protein